MVNNGIAKEAVLPKNEGWLDLLKKRLHFDEMVDKAWSSKNIAIDMILYGSIGFLSGFLLKKYNQYFILLVLLIASFFLLQQLDILFITINWTKVHELMGTQPTGIVEGNLLILMWEWVKINVAITVSFVVGFLAGLRVG